MQQQVADEGRLARDREGRTKMALAGKERPMEWEDEWLDEESEGGMGRGGGDSGR